MTTNREPTRNPPAGFEGWLDFALHAFGAPDISLSTLDASMDRDAVLRAAQAELKQLRQVREDARLALGHRAGPKGIFRFKTHTDQNAQEDRWLAEEMAMLAAERRRQAPDGQG